MIQENKNTPIIILTRFNLAIRYNFKKLYKNGDVNNQELWIDSNYLKGRFELFEKYTLESLMNQSDMNYKWIIMFHKDTPALFKEKIIEYKERLTNIEDWYFDDEESQNYEDIIADYLRKQYGNQNIITIRLDNDDSIHRDYLANVRRKLENENDETVLSFKNGLQYSVGDKRLIRFPFKTNHFLAVKCNAQNDRNNALQNEHMKINEQYDHVLYVKTKIPQWIEIVSETNCVNMMHYTFNKVFVRYNLKTEYPYIDLDWDSRAAYFKYLFNLSKKMASRSLKSTVRKLKK